MLSALITLDELQQTQSTVAILAVCVVVLCMLFRLAWPILRRMPKKARVVFCTFAVVATLLAQKATTNAPPDDASGPVPEHSDDPVSDGGFEGDDPDGGLPDDVPGPLFALAPLYLVDGTAARPGAIVLPLPSPVVLPEPALQNSPVFSADLWVSEFTHTVSQSCARVAWTNATRAFAGVPISRRRVEALVATTLADGGDWSYFTNVAPWSTSLMASYADFVFETNALPPAAATNSFFGFGANIDSDSDGYSDLEEMFVYRTDPFSADTDGDGDPDGQELSGGANPHDPSDGLLLRGRTAEWYVLNYPGDLSAVTNSSGEVVVDLADLSQTNLYYNLYLAPRPHSPIGLVTIGNENGFAPDGASFMLSEGVTNVIPLRVGQSYLFGGIYLEDLDFAADDPSVVIGTDGDSSFTVCRPVRVLLSDVPPPPEAQRCTLGHVHARYCGFSTDPDLPGVLALYDTDCVTVDNVSRTLKIERSRVSPHHGANYYLDRLGSLGTFTEADGTVDLVFDDLSPYSLGENTACFCGNNSDGLYCTDCIGSTAAWHNLMFLDLLTATNASDGAVSISWNDGVASNAYYFVELVTTNKSVRVTVTPRLPTMTRDYQVQLLAGMTARIPLLAGDAYDLVGNADDLGFSTFDADVAVTQVSNRAYAVARPLEYNVTERPSADTNCTEGHVHARHFRITTSVPDIPGELILDDTKCFTPTGLNEFIAECDGCRGETCSTNGVITGRFIYEGVTNSFAIPAPSVCLCDNRHHPTCPCGAASLCDGCDTTIYGQDENWVRANFDKLRELDSAVTNVEDILSVGYTNWVDACVGVGLVNGIYKFTAEFPEDPPEATRLYIGDYVVYVKKAGEYVFLLGKGTDYEFGTWPYVADVDYWAQDDMADDSPLLRSWWGEDVTLGEWTVGGGEHWMDYPFRWDSDEYSPGWCSWMPTLKGTPDLLAGETMTFPMTFSVQFDYPGADQLTYYWTSSDRHVQFSSPHSQSTVVFCDQAPRWGELSLSVSTYVGDIEFASMLTTLYGADSIDRLGVSCCCPEYFDTYRDGESLTPITLVFNSSEPTNGVVKAFGWTLSGLRLYYDRGGTEPVPDLFQETLVAVSAWRRTLYAKGELYTENVGDGVIYCYFDDGQAFAQDKVQRVDFTVVDRNAEPILSLPKPNSDPRRYFNPCCAAPSSEVNLCVSVLPSTIADNRLGWRCVSGDAVFITPPTGREVAVRMGRETAVFEIDMPDVLSSAPPMRLTVRAMER